MRTLTKEEWKKKKKRRKYFKVAAILGLMLSILVLFIILIKMVLSVIHPSESESEVIQLGNDVEVQQMLLTPSKYTRPQTELEKVEGIVIHYVGNSGTTAKENRDYFESLKDSKEKAESFHFIVGLDGEVIQCIPMNEVAYASKDRNMDSISIEFCHEDTEGKPNDVTYESLVELTTYICKKYDLKADDIIRHYDVSGIECPKYYVTDEAAWKQFISDVEAKLSE